MPWRNRVETECVNSNRYKLDSSISSKGKVLLSALRLPDHLPPHADINTLISTSTLPDTFMVWCSSTEQLYVCRCSCTKACVQFKDVYLDTAVSF